MYRLLLVDDEKDICDDDVLTHSSREVLFHITGFYQ